MTPAEGDVDHEYCRRVTLAYLTHINDKKATNYGTEHLRE